MTLLKLLCNSIEKLVVIIMPVKFEATLVKWGNSVGFALPKPIRDGLELNAGDKIIRNQNFFYYCFVNIENFDVNKNF